MKKYLLCFICFLISGLVSANHPVGSNLEEQCVIVLHGMNRTSASMWFIEKQLSDTGYQVWNETYPSRKMSSRELANLHVKKGVEFCQQQQAKHIHFVSHSLGGILVRQYFQDKNVENLGRIVMLAPPNHGSEIADKFKDWDLYQWVAGEVGQELTTDENSTPNSLLPIDAEVGVITGNKNYEPWFKFLFEGESDGKVSVESAKLFEMKDFLVVKHAHATVMWNKEVIKQTLHFFQTGQFDKTMMQNVSVSKN